MNRGWLPSLLIVLLWATPAAAQTCTYTVDPQLNFGQQRAVVLPQTDVVANIAVTCTGLLSALQTRVCLSIPAGSAGTIDDRQMLSGTTPLRFQIYSNAARTNVWGAFGSTPNAIPVDFPLLAGTSTINVPVYGRILSGQAGKPVGTYTSTLAPIQARVSTTLLVLAPSCSTIGGATATLTPMTVRATILSSCLVTATNMSFGTVTTLAGHVASTNVGVTCTPGAPYTIALNGGSVSGNVNARRMRLGAGPSTIDYQLYRDSARTAVWGNTTGTTVAGVGTGSPAAFPVYGLVPAQGPKPPGTYTDTITVTVTF